jgi:tripartite-type tricarboxylate transporter receptor subunit TctC
MRLPRRRFLHLAAGALALPAVPQLARAETYPSRAVHLQVGFAAGSASDVIARLTAQWLSERLGQAFVTENRPGAATNLAAENVVNAVADGYTLLLATSTNAVNTTLYHNLKFNFSTDLAPAALIDLVPYVLEVTPSLPVKTLSEFIAYAKANPGKINMASNGAGNLSHISGELFKMMAGVDLFHVPYRGELEAQADLLAGRAQVMFDPIISCIGHIKAGKLRALAVTTPKRVDLLPEVPTVSETVPGYEVTGGLGVGAPRDTPSEIIDALNVAIGAGLNDASVKDRLVALGNIPMAMSPADYRALIARDNDKWSKVIKFAGIKLG